MPEAKKGVSAVENTEADGGKWSKGLQIRAAKTAGASKTIEVEVDKPLGLTLGQKSGGGVVITVSNFWLRSCCLVVLFWVWMII